MMQKMKDHFQYAGLLFAAGALLLFINPLVAFSNGFAADNWYYFGMQHLLDLVYYGGYFQARIPALSAAWAVERIAGCPAAPVLLWLGYWSAASVFFYLALDQLLEDRTLAAAFTLVLFLGSSAIGIFSVSYIAKEAMTCAIAAFYFLLRGRRAPDRLGSWAAAGFFAALGVYTQPILAVYGAGLLLYLVPSQGEAGAPAAKRLASALAGAAAATLLCALLSRWLFGLRLDFWMQNLSYFDELSAPLRPRLGFSGRFFQGMQWSLPAASAAVSAFVLARRGRVWADRVHQVNLGMALCIVASELLGTDFSHHVHHLIFAYPVSVAALARAFQSSGLRLSRRAFFRGVLPLSLVLLVTSQGFNHWRHITDLEWHSSRVMHVHVVAAFAIAAILALVGRYRQRRSVCLAAVLALIGIQAFSYATGFGEPTRNARDKARSAELGRPLYAALHDIMAKIRPVLRKRIPEGAHRTICVWLPAPDDPLGRGLAASLQIPPPIIGRSLVDGGRRSNSEEFARLFAVLNSAELPEETTLGQLRTHSKKVDILGRFPIDFNGRAYSLSILDVVAFRGRPPD
ncbi:MAG: hypothetical protein HY926_13835 [Elusimicrobia bacterium]|nr:hypothetical protein [Elusimicrobiota bacterium]